MFLPPKANATTMSTTPPTPDLFISYSRKDQEKADALTNLLIKEGWEVWKDNRLVAGEEYETRIIEALNHAKAVIVLWTKNAMQSQWVMREAEIAAEQHKLKPVLLEPCTVPDNFQKYEMALLSSWSGEKEHPELQVLFAGITTSVIPSRLDNVRKGFNPFFWGPDFKIMLPEVKGAADLIHYANFSVVMNPQRRMAWYVAYNIDATLFHEGLPRNEGWMPDPLWPDSLQPSHAQFRQSNWDRGHLLSPGSVAWGEKRLAGIARRQANY